MATQRAEALEQLHTHGPADIKVKLLAEGQTPEEVERLFRTLPTTRISLHYRLVRRVVLLAWIVAILTQALNALPPSTSGSFVQSVIGLVVSIAFFLAVKRLRANSFGLGMIWLIWLILATVLELDTLTAEDYSDPVFRGMLVSFIALLVAGVLGMAVLKRALFPHTPWLTWRPLGRDRPSASEADVA
jgi:hypothetical protein